MMDALHIYRGLLSSFPEMLDIQKVSGIIVRLVGTSPCNHVSFPSEIVTEIKRIGKAEREQSIVEC